MVSRGVRDRIAAQTAMASVVALQESAPPRSFVARVFGRSPLVAAAREDYRDALGELFVGDMLDNLGQRWDVLHDVPLGASTLDHLVIGPAGVFAVRVVSYGDREVVVDGAVLLAGDPTDDVSEVARQADLASERLSTAAGDAVRVRPLLVVVEPRRLLVRAAPASTHIVASFDLERTLTRADRVLQGDEVALISDLADRESTWPVPQPQTLDVTSLHRSFARVRETVRQAFLRRVFWATASLAVAFVVLWVLVARAVTAILTS